MTDLEEKIGGEPHGWSAIKSERVAIDLESDGEATVYHSGPVT